MRKYYIADLLTLLEVILAGILLWMTIANISVDCAIWVFVAGELCDALDGPCARRWHYPDDGKYRWWRHYNSEIDQASDILLAIACGLYLILRVNTFWGCILLIGIGAFCLILQCTLYAYDREGHRFCRRDQLPYQVVRIGTLWVKRTPSREDQALAEKLILFRRIVYVFGGIGGAIALLIWSTSWPTLVKFNLSIFGIAAGLILAHKKRNRLTEDQTPL